MKRINLCIFLLILGSATAFSQAYILEYNSKNIDRKDYSNIPVEHRKQLRANRNRITVSNFKYVNGKSSYIPSYSIISGEKTNSSKWLLGKLEVYKNFSEGVYIRVGSVLGEKAIKDRFDDFDWTIESSKDTIIHGFKCVKATANIYSDFVSVWFAEEIPIMDGPSYYAGLPGLILHVRKRNTITAVANIQIIEKTPKEVVIPTTDNYMSHADYMDIPRPEKIKIMNKLLSELME